MLHFKSLILKRIGLWAWSIGAGVYLALNFSKFWTDSEMWASVAVKYLFEGHPDYYFPLKPVMNFILWVIYKWSLILEQHPMLIARVVWGMAGLVVMILVDQILVTKKISKFSRFLCQLCFFSTSTWVFRSGEVRSDALALLILMSFYLLSLRWEKEGYRLFTLCFGGALATLATPKALIFIVALSPLLFWSLKDYLFTKRNAFILVVGSFVFLLAFREPLFQAFVFFTHQFSAQEGGIPYFSLIRFEHIIRMAIQNLHVDVLVIFALIVGFRKRMSSEVISLSLILVLIVSYPDPLPFFLSSLIPWVLICVWSLLDGYTQKLSVKNKMRVAVLASVTAVSLFTWRGYQMFEHSNHNQRKVVEWANQEFKGENLLIYDPTGLLWLSNAEHWFLGPGMANDLPRLMKHIEQKKPDIVFYTGKAIYLNFKLPDFLLKNYRSPAPTIWTLNHYEFKSPPPIDNFMELFRYDTTF